MVVLVDIGLAGPEAQVPVDREGDPLETEGLEHDEQPCRVDRVVGVIHVEGMQFGAGQAVRSDQQPSRAQYPQRLGQGRVLRRQRRKVVQHGERGDRVEAVIGKRRTCAVADHHLDISSFILGRQTCRRVMVELNRDQAIDALAQPASRGTRPRAQLEQLPAQINSRQQRPEHLPPEPARPVCARAQF